MLNALLIISALLISFCSLANTTPPIGIKPSNIIIVDKNAPNAFHSIQAAIDNSNQYKSVTILISAGHYNEKLFITRNNVNLVGSSALNTTIEYAELRNNWRKDHDSDWGAAVINIAGSDITIANLKILNSYGRQHNTTDHQFAIRGFENASRIILHNCHVVADGADTVSLWNKKNGMYYHSHCTFEGATDMVCPRGHALIEHSSFINHRAKTATLWHDGELNSDQKFVVSNSQFKGTQGYFLARHHYDAQFYLINNHFSKTMADQPIFKKTYINKERDRANKFGSRYFFSNNQAENPYPWLKDNFNPSKTYLQNQSIEQWVFNDQWSPKQTLKDLQGIISNTQFNFTEFKFEP
ncbi:MAG: polysaccharide lyase [Paraglaciecola sp.]|nr:polysaccharide lyase [Paraglaciecola sp.]